MAEGSPRAPALLTLDAGQVHVLAIDLATCDPSVFDRVPLDDDERWRAERFGTPELRVRFERRHQLLRLLLARYLDTTPDRVLVERGLHGKPELTGNANIQFSLSHRGDRVLYAFSRGRRVGVDLEVLRVGIDGEGIARNLFAAFERERLDALPPLDRPDAFYRVWARKEAYVKALGMGLSMALDSFAVPIEEEAAAAVVWCDGRPDEHDRWALFTSRPFPAHIAALVVERPCGMPELVTMEQAGIVA